MMLPYKKGVLLDAAIHNGLAACHRVILVAGYRADELITYYRDLQGVTVLNNLYYARGMLGSIQTGLRVLTQDYFFISHGDMPYLEVDLYRTLWSFRHYDVIFPGNPAQPGHPVLLSKKIVPLIQAAQPNGSMRQLILKSGYQHYLGLADTRIYHDIDTLTDYQILLQNGARI